MAESPEWLKEYYQKINLEKTVSLQRKDSFTNWALVTLLGFFAIYGQFFLIVLPPFIHFAALAIVLILLFRFYLRSCIAYTDIRRCNLLSRAIEQHWIRGKPKMNRIEYLIRLFDHDCWSVVSLGKTLRAQLKAGFFVLFLAPLLALIYEIFNLHLSFLSLSIPLETLLLSYAILAFLIIYIILDLLMIRKHQPLRQKPTKSKVAKQ